MKFKQIYILLLGIIINIVITNGTLAANLNSGLNSTPVQSTVASIQSNTASVHSVGVPITIGSGWQSFTWGIYDFFPVPLPYPMPDNEGPFTFTSTGSAIINVTDAFLTGDVFDVSDKEKLLGTTTYVPKLGPYVWTNDPNTAYSDPRWSHGSFTVGPGSHSVTLVTVQGYDYGEAYIKVENAPLSIDVSPDDIGIGLTDSPNTNDGGSDHYTPDNIKIKVTDVNKKPVPNTEVEVRAITVPGSGGHENDSNGAEATRDPEKQTDIRGVTRPMANLVVSQGTLVRKVAKYPAPYNNICNDLVVETDNSGEAAVTYTPPNIDIVGSAILKRVVAGVDHVNVSLVSDSTIKTETNISVFYIGFHKFVGDSNVTLDYTGENGKQRVHDDFWCTANTNQSIHYMADNYRAWWNEKYGKNKNMIFSPLRITAMSLIDGGLSDIYGDWKEPHKTHSNGKCVDIGKNGLTQDAITELDELYRETKNNARQNYFPEAAQVLHYSFKN